MGVEQRHVPAGHVVYPEAWRLLFGEAGAVPGYCLPARTVAAVIAKVLLLPLGHYIDDFMAALLAENTTAIGDLWEFSVDILKFVLQRKKFNFGDRLLYLWMEIRFSHDGILFVISENRCKKYVEILRRYLDRNQLLRPGASQLARRLNWACNALFGRCGRAFLSPIPARAVHREACPELNKDLVNALKWWKRWLSAPRGDLSRFILAAPPGCGQHSCHLLRCQHRLRPRGCPPAACHPRGILVSHPCPTAQPHRSP